MRTINGKKGDLKWMLMAIVIALVAGLIFVIINSTWGDKALELARTIGNLF